MTIYKQSQHPLGCTCGRCNNTAGIAYDEIPDPAPCLPDGKYRVIDGELFKVDPGVPLTVYIQMKEHIRDLERQLAEANDTIKSWSGLIAAHTPENEEIPGYTITYTQCGQCEKLKAELAKCKLNDKWNDEDKRLEVEIIGKCLVISVGIGIIAFAFETHEDNSPYNDDTNDFKKLWIVSDKLQFAKDVISAMLEESETGASPITDFIDTMSRAALEDGSIAIDEAGPIPEPEGE